MFGILENRWVFFGHKTKTWSHVADMDFLQKSHKNGYSCDTNQKVYFCVLCQYCCRKKGDFLNDYNKFPEKFVRNEISASAH